MGIKNMGIKLWVFSYLPALHVDDIAVGTDGYFIRGGRKS